nr:FAD-dependent oxidoreductase [Bradyrhizobium japonicum]
MRSLFARLHRRYGPRISGAERQRRVKDKLALQPTPPAIRSPTALRALAVRRPKVAIIGGGFAGLMAASELVAHCEVTLFEARDRFGGRVLSKKKPSGIVEAGGELIGYNHPLWLKYAKRFELGLSVITSDTNFDALELDMPLFLDGHKLSDGQMKLVYHEMDDAFGKLSRWAGRVKPDKPWRAKGARKLDARTIAEWIASLDCSKLTKHAMEEQFSNDAGQPTTKQSLLANLAVVAGGRMKNQIDAFFTQTETLRCSEGNQELAIRLAQDIKDNGASTHLSTPVRAIRIDSEGVTLEFSPSGNGTARAPFAADYAVLAIPPSLWPDSPNAKITITPHLPHDYYVTMGTAVKYLSPLKKRFWIGEGLAPTAISNQFGVTWEGTDNQIAPRSSSACSPVPMSRPKLSSTTGPVTRRRSTRSTRSRSAASTRAMSRILPINRSSWPGRATNGPPPAIPVPPRARSAAPGRCWPGVSRTACSLPASTPALPISVTWKALSSPARRRRPRSSRPSTSSLKRRALPGTEILS